MPTGRYSEDANVPEYVILVDEHDNQIGTEEKVKCHLPDGRLHRAFTALIFDDAGRLLLTQRSEEKMLWPGDWDGTFASHPRRSETYLSSAARRMPEELGIACQMHYAAKFEYHVPYRDIGSENEICGMLVGIMDRQTRPSPVRTEISGIRWTSAGDLLREIRASPEGFCPWMLIALAVLDGKPPALERCGDVLSEWTSPEFRAVLPAAIRAHLPDEKWRIMQ